MRPHSALVFLALAILSPLSLAQTQTSAVSSTAPSRLDVAATTTGLAGLGSGVPTVISAFSNTIPPSSLLAMETSQSLIYASSAGSAPLPADATTAAQSPSSTDSNYVSTPVPGSQGDPSTATNRYIIIGTVVGFVVIVSAVFTAYWCMRVHHRRRMTFLRASQYSPDTKELDIEKTVQPTKSKPAKGVKSPNQPAAPVVRGRGHLTTICVSEIFDDLHMLGIDGSYNPPPKKITSPAAASARTFSDRRRARASTATNADVNKPLPVPKLALTRNSRGRSTLDSANPFASPPLSPFAPFSPHTPLTPHTPHTPRSPGAPQPSPRFAGAPPTPQYHPLQAHPTQRSASHRSVSPPSPRHSSARRSAGSASSVSPPASQASSGADTVPSLRRTRTTPAGPARLAYTPSVYSERINTPLAELDGMPGFAAFAPADARLGRSPSLPLPRKSSKRKSQPAPPRAAGAAALAAAALAEHLPADARRFSFLAEQDRARNASVASDVPRPSPLRVVSGGPKTPSPADSSSASGGGVDVPESPPWPPSQWSRWASGNVEDEHDY